MADSLYFEIHITIAPDFDRLDEAQKLAKACGFHMGDLLLMKREDERSHKDMFFTARAPTYKEAKHLTRGFAMLLTASGFSVIRYKIEDTVLDSRILDKLGLLS